MSGCQRGEGAVQLHQLPCWNGAHCHQQLLYGEKNAGTLGQLQVQVATELAVSLTTRYAELCEPPAAPLQLMMSRVEVARDASMASR